MPYLIWKMTILLNNININIQRSQWQSMTITDNIINLPINSWFFLFKSRPGGAPLTRWFPLIPTVWNQREMVHLIGITQKTTKNIALWSFFDFNFGWNQSKIMHLTGKRGNITKTIEIMVFVDSNRLASTGNDSCYRNKAKMIIFILIIPQDKYVHCTKKTKLCMFEYVFAVYIWFSAFLFSHI